MQILKGGPGGKNSDTVIKSETDEALDGLDIDMSAVVDFVKEHGLGSFGEAKHRIIKNINPRGYQSLRHNSMERLIKAILLDEPERDKKYSEYEVEVEEARDEAGYENDKWLEIRNDHYKERTDLLSMVLGQDQKYNSIEDAIYTPSNSKDSDAKYYRSRATEARIQDAIDNNRDFSYSSLIDNRQSIPDYHDLDGNTLGNFTLSVGYDEEKGLPYISYYDIWDLNPFSQGVGMLGDRNISRDMENAVYGALGLESPEIYGRVYFDPNKYDHTNFSTRVINQNDPEYLERALNWGLRPEEAEELERVRNL